MRGGLTTLESAETNQMDRQHIFVVNGASDFLDVVRELLEEEHYNITTTNFVPKTFDQIVTLDPSLLIIDLAVGVTAGWELLERVSHAAATRDVPVIIVSTSPRYLDKVRDDPAKFGNPRLIGKPFDLDELLGIVDELIGSA